MDGLQNRTPTESLCPVCLQRLPAQRVPAGDEVRLVKACPRHGTFETAIWRGKPSFNQWQRPKMPGQRMLVVVPPLTREAMPLVRYRTGHRAAAMAAACPCGTVLRRLENG